jgi:uncharacterized protein YndB with AHSA1/START domain
MLLDLTIKKTIFLEASSGEVWDALTDPEKIKLYLFGTETSCDWKKGSPIVFTGVWEEKSYREGGTILEIDKERLLKYDYRSSFSSLPDLPENYALITFTLQPRSGGTELTLEQEGFESQAAFEHSGENWGTVLEGLRKIL